MAQLTYREAVARGIAQEMRRDPAVVFLGEDVAGAGGVFKTTAGLLAEFGPVRVVDTPISEQAILGAAMGAAMTGMRPIAEIMFADFFAVCWDMVVNQIAKARYMTNGQVSCPLVIKSGNGGSVRFGAQHSQSVENWAMAVPGIKVVAPSTATDVVGLMAAAVRDPDPVLFFEHKGLYASKEEVPDGEIVDRLGTAKVLRDGGDCTVVALGLMVPRAMAAAESARRRGHRGHGDRPAQPRPPRHGHRARLGVGDGPAVHGRGEPAGLRVGRRGRLDRRRRGVLGPRRPDRADHHAAPAAPGGRGAGGPGHPVRRAHRHDDPRVAGLTGEGAGW